MEIQPYRTSATKGYAKFFCWGIIMHTKLVIPANFDNVALYKCHDNPDQPIKFTDQDEENLVRPITKLCNTHDISFTAGKIKKQGVLHHVALKTGRYYINKNDYYFKRQKTKKRFIYAKENFMLSSGFSLKISFTLMVFLFCISYIRCMKWELTEAEHTEIKANDCT